MSISDYLASFRHDIERLDTYGFAESIIFQEELRAGKQAVIKAEIVLVDGSCLIIREYIGSKYGIEKLSYAYQYHDRDENLIFRYDNAAHKPKLNFVNHKHSSSGIEMANPPEMSELVDEVIACL
ncbi:MAG: hypothetical protein HQK66_05015 [Desulfamplus sp.]|nr:hypothetical protein [Desulfamplus sp.]